MPDVYHEDELTGYREPYLGISGWKSYFKAFGLPAAYFYLVVACTYVPGDLGFLVFLLSFILVPSVLFSLGLALIWGCGAMVLERLRGRPTRAIQRLTVAVAVAGFASFGSAVFLHRILPRPVPPLPSGSHTAGFNSAAWRAESASYSATYGITPRQEMLGSLIKQLTPRMSRAEIEDLLGPPAKPGWPYGAEDSDLHYYTGRERDNFMGLDSEWLLIYLDEDGYFSRYSIYVD